MKREQGLRQLALLRERQLRLLGTYRPDSAPLKSVELRIAEAERQAGVQSQPLTATPTIATDSSSAEELRKEFILERSRMVSAMALLNLLVEQKDATEQDMQRLNQNESRILELERQQEIQDAAYRRFAEALDAAKNQLALAPDQLSNIFEVEPATLPIRPEMPETLKKQVLMAGALGFGLFGGLAFMLAGNMCCGIVGETLMARVGLDQYAEALQRDHAREMDFTGKALKGMIYVGPDGVAEDTDLREWVQLCRNFAESLPPK